MVLRPSKAFIRSLIPVLIAICLVAGYLAFSPGVPVTVRLHDDQIDVQKFTNAVAAFIIENGYGCRVKLVESTVKEIHDRLVTGDIDVTLELWTENNLAWFKKALAAGDIIDLGVLYSGGRQYWIIPRWYAEEKKIRSVFDMDRHWRDFVNPEDPSKGLFFNCIFGWACRDINTVKLKAYGLDRYYNPVSPISPEALKSIYENSLSRRVPVFGYYWEPNAIMTGHDWFPLEEPPYSESVWLDILDAAASPETASLAEACAYRNNAVHKVAHSSLPQKAPEVSAMLSRMTLDIGTVTMLLERLEPGSRDARFFQDMAVRFLRNSPDQWHTWVTSEARQRIESALSGTNGRS